MLWAWLWVLIFRPLFPPLPQVFDYPSASAIALFITSQAEQSMPVPTGSEEEYVSVPAGGSYCSTSSSPSSWELVTGSDSSADSPSPSAAASRRRRHQRNQRLAPSILAAAAAPWPSALVLVGASASRSPGGVLDLLARGGALQGVDGVTRIPHARLVTS